MQELCTQDITDICPRNAWYLLIICLGYTSNIPETKYTQDIDMRYTWDMWDVPQT